MLPLTLSVVIRTKRICFLDSHQFTVSANYNMQEIFYREEALGDEGKTYIKFVTS